MFSGHYANSVQTLQQTFLLPQQPLSAVTVKTIKY